MGLTVSFPGVAGIIRRSSVARRFIVEAGVRNALCWRIWGSGVRVTRARKAIRQQFIKEHPLAHLDKPSSTAQSSDRLLARDNQEFYRSYEIQRDGELAAHRFLADDRVDDG